MAWYNPASWDWSGAFGLGSGDPSNPDRENVRQTGNNLSDFGDQARAGYGADTQALDAQRQYLMGLASGQNSVSAEQLRQGLQQQLAQQRAMAASANPNNAAMAARNAAMNMQRSSYGMAGQQAIAGLQERNQANEALANLNLGARGQDLSGTLGGYGGAAGAYGAALGNPQKTWGGMLMGAIQGAAGYAAAKSDRRAKTDVADGEGRANKAISGLKAYAYKYKDERDGKGEQLGIMAQDLEKQGLGHAVIDTPSGKYVHGGKLATANTAMIAALGKRVAELEKRGGKAKDDEREAT